jgi:hypothetical protein
MKTKQVDAEYSYDYDLDIVNVEFKQDYVYRESIDFDVGVFLDFDINDCPVNLEILSASKRLGIERDCLTNPIGNVNISIFADVIKLDVKFEISGREHVLHYVDRHNENLKINNLETEFAIV